MRGNELTQLCTSQIGEDNTSMRMKMYKKCCIINKIALQSHFSLLAYLPFPFRVLRENLECFMYNGIITFKWQQINISFCTFTNTFFISKWNVICYDNKYHWKEHENRFIHLILNGSICQEKKKPRQIKSHCLLDNYWHLQLNQSVWNWWLKWVKYEVIWNLARLASWCGKKPVTTKKVVWWTECLANSFNTLLIHCICIRLLHVLFLTSFVLML